MDVLLLSNCCGGAETVQLFGGGGVGGCRSVEKTKGGGEGK